MARPDELIHQSLRLKVMAALNAAGEPVEFSRLKALVGATDGNLSSHLSVLEGAGYLDVEKDFAGRKPRTRVAISAKGATAFREHSRYLRQIIEGAIFPGNEIVPSAGPERPAAAPTSRPLAGR